MSSSGYKLLGYAVWHGARWYLRRRFSPRRALAARLLGGAALAAGAALLARRASA
ncbi:MAG TPA: hypothetical protein VHT27_06905 [Solirubrobacteraceae bacterium]|jgi:hypothetical protein|nr:hypothetical protein [Solirubrobacteraceae bacterium]